jgi:hypothetical protein
MVKKWLWPVQTVDFDIEQKEEWMMMMMMIEFKQNI